MNKIILCQYLQIFLYFSLFFNCCKCPRLIGTKSIILLLCNFIKPLKELSFSERFFTDVFASSFEVPFNPAYCLALMPSDFCRKSWQTLTWRLAEPSVMTTDNCQSFVCTVESFIFLLRIILFIPLISRYGPRNDWSRKIAKVQGRIRFKKLQAQKQQSS